MCIISLFKTEKLLRPKENKSLPERRMAILGFGVLPSNPQITFVVWPWIRDHWSYLHECLREIKSLRAKELCLSEENIYVKIGISLGSFDSLKLFLLSEGE